MRLASVRGPDGDEVAVGADGSRVVGLARLLSEAGSDIQAPRSMKQLIEAWSAIEGTLQEAAALAATSAMAGFAYEPQAWYPPIRQPGKILAVAMNNSASNARKISAPEHPAFFLKPPSCLIGHGQPIRVRTYYGSVHPEPELAVVIGRRMKDVPAADAMRHVFGYSIMNDVTGNGMRAEDRFHYWAIYARKDAPDQTERVEQHLSYAARYKGSDCFGVLGPWLVTADDVPDPDSLGVTCSIGGEPIADDNTRYYNYKVAEILSFISFFQTLWPGEIVSMGTAFKPGSTRKSIHQADFQSVPGPVEISIERLGTQHNPIRIEDRPLGAWRLPTAPPT